MVDNEKSQLYKRIVQQTNDWMLLERMRMHGFWPKGQKLPEDPPDEHQERNEIESELKQLRQKQLKVKNPEKLLHQERVRRWEESKKRRAKVKAEKAEQKKQRRLAWDAEKKDLYPYAGPGVSSGLQDAKSDISKLVANGLPIMHSAGDLASFLKINLSQLRWLSYHRRGAAVVHYHRYSIPKKTGGQRAISAPKSALSEVQQAILEGILNPIQVEDDAHGFVKQRSIVTNAIPHANKDVVVNLDLKDFFPSIGFRRVKGLFHKLGYSEQVATVLALLSTEPPRVKAEVAGKVYYIALGDRVLPQGACTSPALTNLICRKLDRRLRGLGAKFHFQYTRYADDLTFSGSADGDKPPHVGCLLGAVRRIISDEGFTENSKKTHVMRRGRRQEVTGLTVNSERPTVSRKERRALRAILHNAAKHGLDSQNKNNHPRFADYLKGRVSYLASVDAKHGAKFKELLSKALGQS
ncbi:MAG: reverse transcriptase domain-containing protein [Planctomycetota bacterium]|nr:reverse transcriptase domain-containing protein [Planctomycetota bacterium]